MAAVFASGAVVGAFGHRLYTVRSVDAAVNERRSPADFRKRYVNELRGRLNLDETQTARVGQILDETRARFKTFNEKYKPELTHIHDQQVQDINAILNPVQQQRYEEYRKERDRKRSETEKK